MCRAESIIQVLKNEMLVAMGCTEPAAAALAGNKAVELLGLPPERLTVYASPEMIKNAMSVGIPNCEERGLLFAVCLGACSDNGAAGLSILSRMRPGQSDEAVALAKKSRLELAEGVDPVYVRVAAEGGGHSASAVVSEKHDHFSELIRDGRSVAPEFQKGAGPAADEDFSFLERMEIKDVLNFIAEVDVKDVAFVLDMARTNLDLARYSIREHCGLRIAETVLEGFPEQSTNLHEAMTKAAAYASAGSDARMSGCARAVVINSGSGNQGITCTVPLLVLAEYLASSDAQQIKALCISELVGLLITARKGRLSALCGVLTAAIGAGCGMVHLMGGGLREMNLLVRNMVSNLSGMICDGAKNSCALKIYSSVEAAGLAARMAFKGQAPGAESGIVGADASESIDALMKLSHEGMADTNAAILAMMLDKQR